MVIIIQNLVVVDGFSAFDFPYTVKWIYPMELSNEEIFKKNIRHTFADLKELVKEKELLKANEEMLKMLYFSSQIERQNKHIAENQERIQEITRRMNDEIHPYYWEIFEKVDTFVEGIHIKSDYVLKLQCKVNR